MKIKQLPSDFIVREINATDGSPEGPKLGADGNYSIYHLAKESIGTLEALNALGQIWDIGRKHISAGGLKDRHAQTEQLISIYHGPAKDYQHSSFKLKYLGRADQPISPASFTHNQFIITLRDLSKAEASQAQERFRETAASGLPNYFDEQRFGSVRGSLPERLTSASQAGNEFSAKLLIRGDYETALKIALTSTSGEDRRSVREVRATIKEYWGRWRDCMQVLPRSSERSIINYLKDHPQYFRNAYELMDQKLVRLYLNAYQSYLWNKAVARLIKEYAAENQIISYHYMLGEFLFYQQLPKTTMAELQNLTVPFITHRTQFADQKIKLLMEEILKEEGLELQEFKIRGMKKTYFRKGERRMIIFPEIAALQDAEPDELNNKKLKLTLDFKLPRGSYATILIKRLSYDFDISD